MIFTAVLRTYIQEFMQRNCLAQGPHTLRLDGVLQWTFRNIARHMFNHIVQVVEEEGGGVLVMNMMASGLYAVLRISIIGRSVRCRFLFDITNH
jgi:hypothetical protein